MVKRVSPKEASQLLGEGYIYLDVRSVPEYREGHPVGARNIPLMHLDRGRMTANADFNAVVQRRFDKGAKLVVGCKSGGRSQRAAAVLEQLGYTAVVDMRGGFDGEVDPQSGKVAEPGWSRVGLPVETVTAGGAWDELLALGDG